MAISNEKIPFAAWYWESTDTYTIWYLVKAQQFLPYTFENEKTGYVLFNFNTAKQIIKKLEMNFEKRIQILDLAYKKAIQLEWL